MNKDVKEALEKIQNERFTDEEIALINYSNTPNTNVINHSKVFATLILAKEIEKSSADIISSNKKLAASEDRHSRRMFWLTCSLLFVGFLQCVSMFISLLK